MVLDSVARLKSAGVPCELRCLGDGPERPALERQSRELGISDAVHFPGYVSHQTVAECLQQAHFSILASGTEGFPKVLGEAMLQGAVPLASDIGLNAQIVGCGSRGLTFPYNDAAALAAIIERLAMEPLRVAAMMREGFDYSKTLTFESFRDQIRSTLERHWKVQWSQQSPVGK
jgi:glycosyltransferase involved in cell wall biosynthesis